MAAYYNSEYDILLTNISKIYGPPEETQKELKTQLLNKFKENNWIYKYGPLQSVRIPFNLNYDNQDYYYGFLTMLNPNTHDLLLEDIKDKEITFGSIKLKFSKSSRLRIPNNKQIQIQENDFKEQRNKRKSTDDIIEISNKLVKQEPTEGETANIGNLSLEEREEKIRLKEMQLEEKEENLNFRKAYNISTIERLNEKEKC